MKIVDQLFGWAMIVLGAIFCEFVFRSHGLDSPSSYSGGMIIVIAGLVNVARVGASGAMLRFASAFANVFVLLTAITNAFTLRDVLHQNPQAPILVIAALVEVIFAIWG